MYTRAGCGAVNDGSSATQVTKMADRWMMTDDDDDDDDDKDDDDSKKDFHRGSNEVLDDLFVVSLIK